MYPPLVPILVGNTNPRTEKHFGSILAPYLADPTSIFVVSSDFAHWGSRFGYTYYKPSNGDPVDLSPRNSPPRNPQIYKSIMEVDHSSMDAIETGKHDDFLTNLEETGNTVCGRHPIGVVMAAVEVLAAEGKVSGEKGRFKFVRYERSGDVVRPDDSSVSYCSAFAIF
jgi:MEMO1 family protein